MKNLNLPNVIASIRILLAPLFLFLLLQTKSTDDAGAISWLNYFAALVFSIASISDFFDGYIARAWDQRTKLGEILDPLADKMLILGAFLGLAMIDRANVWAVYIILVREFFITGFRVVLAIENISIKANFAGKLKTTFQMIAVGFLTMQWVFGELLLWIAVALTLYSGATYIISYAKHK